MFHRLANNFQLTIIAKLLIYAKQIPHDCFHCNEQWRALPSTQKWIREFMQIHPFTQFPTRHASIILDMKETLVSSDVAVDFEAISRIQQYAVAHQSRNAAQNFQHFNLKIIA